MLTFKINHIKIICKRTDFFLIVFFLLMQEKISITNIDFDCEEYDVIEKRKDIEENLLLKQIMEENQINISNDHNDRAIFIDDIDNEYLDDIERRKNAEEILLGTQIEEERMNRLQEDMENCNFFSEDDDESYEELEKRKDAEDFLLIIQLNDEIMNSTINDSYIDDESYEEIEKRKDFEENELFNQIDEENIDDCIDEIIENGSVEGLNEEYLETDEIDDLENLKDNEESLIIIQLSEEKSEINEIFDIIEKEKSNQIDDASVFPVPDCLSCSSNEEKRSVASITEIESSSNIPSETPFKHKSMIPVQTGRKIPLPREIFETPSFRTQGRDKFDPHLLSEMKPKARNGTKGHSSIPVNQGRKQMNKKVSAQTNKKDSKEEKDKTKSFVKKATNVKKANVSSSINSKSNEEDNKNTDSSKQQAPKTISKKQLKNLTERLAPITPASGKQQRSDTVVESVKSIPQTPCCSNNHDIFNRLFEMSTCKKKMPNAEEEKVEETPAEVQPIMSAKSNHLALKKDIVKISNVVGQIDECNKENLERIMKELKIVDSTTTDQELKMIEDEYSQCIVNKEKNIYSAKQLETRILDSLSLKKHRKFNIYVNRRLAIVRANEKVVIEQPEEKPEPVKCSTRMHRVTFDRLIAVKPAAPESDNQNVNDITLKKEAEQVRISKASQFILQKSQRSQEIMDMPLDQRDNYLMKLRNQSIQKLEESLQLEEEKELKTKPSNLGALPKFYGQIQQELKQRSSKQSQSKKESEKESKPKKLSYNDFQKMKGKIYGAEPKIAGVEERIKRLRLARIERNELQEALDPRALPTELKNMKKKKNVAKKNASLSSSIIQADSQADPSSETVDDVDNALGI